jgi:hypothetical protein
MALRGVPGFLARLVVGGVRNDAQRYRRAVRRNVGRTFGRPVRTTLSGTFVFGILLALYVVAYRGEATTAAIAANGGDLTLPIFLSLLPSPVLLVPAYIVVVLFTAVSMLLSGIERDVNPGRGYR